jgi:hypothetical protein
MKSISRRNERHPDIVNYLKSHYKKIIDLSENENQINFLKEQGA